MPVYQTAHTSVPGAAEAEAYGVPPVMYQPRNPYASAAYITSGNGVSPLIGYPSQYPHVIHYTPLASPAAVYSTNPSIADALALIRTMSPPERYTSRISSMPRRNGGGSSGTPASQPKTQQTQQQSSPGVYNGDLRVGDDLKLSSVSTGTTPTTTETAPAKTEGSEVYGLHRTNSMNPNGMMPLEVLEQARNTYRQRSQDTEKGFFDYLMDAWNFFNNSDGVDADIYTPLDGRNQGTDSTLADASRTASTEQGLSTSTGTQASTSAQSTTATATPASPTVYDDILPPEVRITVTETAAPAPYQPRDVLPPEVRWRAVAAPSMAPVGQSNGVIPAPVYTSEQPLAQDNPVSLAPLTVQNPVPRTIYVNNPEWFMPTSTREQYSNPTVAADPVVEDLPLGVGNAAQFYYNTLRPGYRENVAPVLDAAGDTLSAAARVGTDLARQGYTATDNAMNRYWAQFFYNQFAKRGAMEGENLNNYLQQAQNLGFYDEALQLLGG